MCRDGKAVKKNAISPPGGHGLRSSSLIRRFPLFQTLVGLYVLAHCPNLRGQATSFHGAPASAKDLTSPSIADSGENGKPLYKNHCASCHGEAGQGPGNLPPLTTATMKSASPGELFWFISKGDPNDGMPSWEQLREKQRWQIVTYLKKPLDRKESLRQKQ